MASVVKYAILKACSGLLNSVVFTYTICVRMFIRHIFRECPVVKGFCDFIYAKHSLPVDLRTIYVTMVIINTAAEEELVHVPSYLFYYCCFGETQLTSS